MNLLFYNIFNTDIQSISFLQIVNLSIIELNKCFVMSTGHIRSVYDTNPDLWYRKSYNLYIELKFKIFLIIQKVKRLGTWLLVSDVTHSR